MAFTEQMRTWQEDQEFPVRLNQVTWLNHPLCWYRSHGKVCIRDRGHDNGKHEAPESTATGGQ